MGTEGSRDRVEARLASLETTYGSFPVNQTTLSVPATVYERARDRIDARCGSGLLDVFVAVYDDGRVLLVMTGDESGGAGGGRWELPSAQPATGARLEGCARDAVREATGVRCSITGVERATIVGLVDETAPGPGAGTGAVYRLAVVLSAERADGSAGGPGEAAEWHRAHARTHALFYARSHALPGSLRPI